MFFGSFVAPQVINLFLGACFFCAGRFCFRGFRKCGGAKPKPHRRPRGQPPHTWAQYPPKLRAARRLPPVCVVQGHGTNGSQPPLRVEFRKLAVVLHRLHRSRATFLTRFVTTLSLLPYPRFLPKQSFLTPCPCSDPVSTSSLCAGRDHRRRRSSRSPSPPPRRRSRSRSRSPPPRRSHRSRSRSSSPPRRSRYRDGSAENGSGGSKRGRDRRDSSVDGGGGRDSEVCCAAVANAPALLAVA